LPFGRYGGGWGSMGLATDDLWDVSRRGIAELHIDWRMERTYLSLRGAKPKLSKKWATVTPKVTWDPKTSKAKSL
jgi:hypothetical protein